MPTKGGNSWKINEENLATLPGNAPQGARLLVERLLVANRVRTLKEWEASYRIEDGRIHGRFNSIGTWPGRMSHQSPNMGNIATKKSIKYKSEKLKTLATDLGGRMRSFWIADDDCWLVGTDKEAAHVRLFAHYINDPVFTKAVVSGDKKLGTDVHTLERAYLNTLDAIEIITRPLSSRTGPPKVAETWMFSCEREALSCTNDDTRFGNPTRKAYTHLR